MMAELTKRFKLAFSLKVQLVVVKILFYIAINGKLQKLTWKNSSTSCGIFHPTLIERTVVECQDVHTVRVMYSNP